MTNPTHQAFPSASAQLAQYCGLTKREYFAAMAMQGMLANIETCRELAVDIQTTGRTFDHEVAAVACDMSDALISELNKK